MHRADCSGFSLIELAIVLVVLGIVVGFGAPAFGRFRDDLALQGTVEHIRSVLALTRERAQATRSSRTVLFEDAAYKVSIGGTVRTAWALPARVSYAWLSGTISTVTMTPDGRCSASGLIILENTNGLRDTVSVLSSGLVLRR